MSGGNGQMSGTGWHYQNYFQPKSKDTPQGNAIISAIAQNAPYAVFQYASTCHFFCDGSCTNSNANNLGNLCKCLVEKTTFCPSYSYNKDAVFQYASTCQYFANRGCSNTCCGNYGRPCKCLLDMTTYCSSYKTKENKITKHNIGIKFKQSNIVKQRNKVKRRYKPI